MVLQLTRSAFRVREGILDFARVAMPPTLARARTDWGLSVTELPDPISYDPYNPEVLDVTPRVAVSLLRTRDYRRVDYGAGGQTWQNKHQVQVYAWLKAEDRKPPQVMRDDYATVLAALFLEEPSLRAGGEFRVDQESMEVSYSDVAKVKGDRWLSGVSVTFLLEHDESVRRVPLGVVEQVQVEATVLPAHHPGAD